MRDKYRMGRKLFLAFPQVGQLQTPRAIRQADGSVLESSAVLNLILKDVIFSVRIYLPCFKESACGIILRALPIIHNIWVLSKYLLKIAVNSLLRSGCEMVKKRYIAVCKQDLLRK